MDLLTFFHNINTNINSAILSVLNPVLFIELTITCCWEMYQPWTIGEATIGKITELALYNAVSYGYCWEDRPLGTSFLIKIAVTTLRNKTLEERTL
jgi:hypothetical protein